MDEFLALAYHQERGLDCVIARLFNTVGPRQSGQYGMVIPRFVERALAGAPLEIHGDGTQTRCFCHVADTIRALRGADGRPRRRRARSSTSARPSGSRSSSSPSACSQLDRLRLRARLRSLRRGLRARDRGHAAPRPVRSRRSARRSAGGPSATSTRSCST